jgi:hypothetical protein
MLGLKGGAVAVPRWIIIIRALQLIFAILVLALTAYALSIDRGNDLRAPLIATLLISILTILPILLLVTPLHLLQRKYFDPRLSLALYGFALLYWTAAYAAIASYHDLFSYYGKGGGSVLGLFCTGCRSQWRAGVAATVFSAMMM